MIRRLVPAVALLFFVLFLWSVRTAAPSGSADIATGGRHASAETRTDAVAAFDNWMEQRDPGGLSAADLEAAVPMAEARRAQMLEWIETDPERALQNAVSWSEYLALPVELRGFFEQPFNTTGALRILPVCGARGHANLHEVEIDGVTYPAGVFGKRLGQNSKARTPLAGILLGGRAAVAEGVLEILSTDDAAALASAPVANPDVTRDFATGEPLKENPVVALAGGNKYLFNGEQAVRELNETLAGLDRSPGPEGGSQLVFEAAKPLDGSTGIQWDTIHQQNTELASTWTENPKNVFFIRVDFSDMQGAAVSQATLAAVLNGPVTDNIEDMSYGKTKIVATVSAGTIRVPQPTSHYLPSDSNALHNDAVAAYKSLHGETSLSSYDIIGVHFPSIGMTGGGVTWAGLATIGGDRQWLQGTSNSGVIIHEFGHNYGLGHASFWQTNDGSVAGSGASVEYGDLFDIMGDGPDPEGHFHMQAKSLLNWIDSTRWVDANASGSGTHRIHRIDHAQTTGSKRGVRANKGGGDSYWIGYRTGIPNNPWLPNGAYIVWQRSGFGRSWLLDMTPGSPAAREDATLAVGRTYSDNAAGVHITPTATGGSGADAWIDVNVQLGGFPGNQAPAANLSAPAAADARASVLLSVSASDPNGDALAYHWDFGDDSVSTNSPTVSHSWPTGGTYQVQVTVTDMKGGTATDSAVVEVGDPLDSWTMRASGTNASLYDITSDGGKLVAVGADRGTYRISTDGSNWTGGIIWVSGNTAYNLVLRGITHDGSKFIAVGYDYDFSINSWIGVIYTSPNGTSWTRVHAGGAELYDVTYGNGMYVAVGNNGTMWRSPDASNWNPVPTGVGQNLRGVAFGNGTFVAVGAYSNGSGGVVLSSTNAIDWTDNSSGAGLASWHGFFNAEYCNNRFLASGWYTKIRHSTDGGVTFPTTETATRQTPGFAYGNGVYLAAGLDRDNADADINLISTDGETWTPLATADQDNRSAAVFFNDTFITVGTDGAIWQSAAFTAPPAGGFAAWLALHFPDSPPLSGPADDFDHDGVPNLAEYATGTNPRDGSQRVDFAAGIEGGYLTITVPKAADATGVTTVVEHSDDLIAWSTAGVTVIEDTAAQLVVRMSAPAGGGPGFLRARFELAE